MIPGGDRPSTTEPKARPGAKREPELLHAISFKEEKEAKEISQLQNRQKIILNRKRSKGHRRRARTHRLIGERGDGVTKATPSLEKHHVFGFLKNIGYSPETG